MSISIVLKFEEDCLPGTKVIDWTRFMVELVEGWNPNPRKNKGPIMVKGYLAYRKYRLQDTQTFVIIEIKILIQICNLTILGWDIIFWIKNENSIFWLKFIIFKPEFLVRKQFYVLLEKNWICLQLCHLNHNIINVAIHI